MAAIATTSTIPTIPKPSRAKAEWLGQLRTLRQSELQLHREWQRSTAKLHSLPCFEQEHEGEELLSWECAKAMLEGCGDVVTAATASAGIARKDSALGQLQRKWTGLHLAQRLDVVDQRLAVLRAEEATLLANEMQQVRTGLSKLRKHVDAASGKSSATNKPSIGSANFLRVLETLLGGVESELMQAKRQRKESGDTLAATERKLEADVWAWEQRVASWAAESGSGADSVAVTASGATTTPRVDSRRRPGDIASTSSLLPEAVEYERFLRKHGGAYGGWDEAAHHVFLKLRTRYRRTIADPLFVATVSSQTGSSAAEVEAHEVWFEQLSTLMQAKKEAIARWKAGRVKNDGGSAARPSTAGRNAHDDEEARAHARRSSSTASEERQRKLQAERDAKRAAIEAWQRERDAEAARKQEIAAEHERQRRERAAAEAQARAETRALVDEYRAVRVMLKEHEEQEHKRAEEQRRRALHTAETTKVLRARQQHDVEVAAERRRKSEEAAREAARHKEERLARIKAPVVETLSEHSARDVRERVRSSTVSAAVRGAKSTAESERGERENRQFFQAGRGAVGVRALPPARAIPSWRKS